MKPAPAPRRGFPSSRDGWQPTTTPYRLTYLATIALVLGGPLYFSFTHDVSPLTPLLFLLLLMPFAPYGWAQIAKIGIGHQGVVIERIEDEVRETFERVCMDRSIAPHTIDDLSCEKWVWAIENAKSISVPRCVRQIVWPLP